MNRATFFIPGIPATGKDWRASIALACKRALQRDPPMTGSVTVEMWFHLPRPKSHYGKGANAGKVQPGCVGLFHTTNPQILRLACIVVDALTGLCWGDAAQIDYLTVSKQYEDGGPGVWVEATEHER